MNRSAGKGFRTERPRKVITALLLANLIGGTAVLLARAYTSNSPVASVHTTTSTTIVTTATTTVTTAVAAAPAPAAAAAATPVDCGQGSAAARAVLTRSGDLYDLSARVTNQADRPIEIDRLAIRAVYPDGAHDLILPTAGLRVETGPKGVEANFPVPGGESAVRPSRFEMTEFRFHTAGHPECASH